MHEMCPGLSRKEALATKCGLYIFKTTTYSNDRASLSIGNEAVSLKTFGSVSNLPSKATILEKVFLPFQFTYTSNCSRNSRSFSTINFVEALLVLSSTGKKNKAFKGCFPHSLQMFLKDTTTKLQSYTLNWKGQKGQWQTFYTVVLAVSGSKSLISFLLEECILHWNANLRRWKLHASVN